MVTNDEYHLTSETVELLKLTGANAYRFSIAWSRLIPGGRDGDKVNQLAIDHYNKFINELIAAGIAPLVTLYHWDWYFVNYLFIVLNL